MEKLESENVSLEFQGQSLIKEQDNVKTEYQKLFNSIKKTRAQTQGEINELIENVKQKTYAYADVRAQNQDLLLTISELKAKLKAVEKIDVHQDEVCPPNKRYALMDANKKVNLENPLCPDESRILAIILQNHPLRFSIAVSSSVPWIYLGQFWHTLQEDGSKNKLKFMLDKKALTLTLDDFRTIFHLPQATNNNHDHFVLAPKFSKMVPYYINNLGFTLELRSTSNFKTNGLLQPWQTLCKMFSRYLTTRVTGYDQPSLQIMQMLYCFVNNIHVDYAE
ncbi:hypothetical protein Tco_1317416 [Tanacetum coccineum]